MLEYFRSLFRAVEETDFITVFTKLSLVWGTFWAGVHIGDIYLFVGLIYTLINLYVLIRDKLLRKPSKLVDTVKGDL